MPTKTFYGENAFVSVSTGDLARDVFRLLLQLQQQQQQFTGADVVIGAVIQKKVARLAPQGGTDRKAWLDWVDLVRQETALDFRKLCQNVYNVRRRSAEFVRSMQVQGKPLSQEDAEMGDMTSPEVVLAQRALEGSRRSPQ